MVALGAGSVPAWAGEVPHPTRGSWSVVGVSPTGRGYVVRAVEIFEDAADHGFCGYPALPDGRKPAGVTLYTCAPRGTCREFVIYAVPAYDENKIPDLPLKKASCTPENTAKASLAKAKKAAADLEVDFAVVKAPLVDGLTTSFVLPASALNRVGIAHAVKIDTSNNLDLIATVDDGESSPRRVARRVPMTRADGVMSPTLIEEAGILVYWPTNGVGWLLAERKRKTPGPWELDLAKLAADLRKDEGP